MNTTTITRLAAATPDTRNRVVDFYRAIAIGVVVLGHWLMAAVVVRDGQVAMANTRERRGTPGRRGSVPDCAG